MAQPRAVATLAGSLSQHQSSTSLVTSAVTSLSDQPTKQVDAHLLDYLTAEVIRMIIDSEAVARARRAEHENLVEADNAAFMLASDTSQLSLKDKKSHSEVSPTSMTPEEQAAADDAVRKRLESMGFKVGWSMAERLARDRPRFAVTTAALPATPNPTAPPPTPDTLDIVKFICKDLWISLYDKQIDNLRTNRRGVYVLHDNGFKPLARMSGAGNDVDVARMVRFFLSFPCGVIRGALANLGVTCTVTADSAAAPQSTFQINTVKS